MKKSSKGTNPCSYTESPAKAKARIKRFEQHNAQGCNHRLANSYANNAPGELPKLQAGVQYDMNTMNAYLAAAKSAKQPPMSAVRKENLRRDAEITKRQNEYYKLKKEGRGGQD